RRTVDHGALGRADGNGAAELAGGAARPGAGHVGREARGLGAMTARSSGRERCAPWRVPRVAVWAWHGIARPVADAAASVRGRRIRFRPAAVRRTAVAVAMALAALSLLAAPMAPAHAQPLPNLDDVIQHLADLYRANSSHATITMRVVRAQIG